MCALLEVFENRTEAGKKLAESLERYRSTNAMVLAVPRGGVIVAYEVASALDLGLDLIVPRKIPAPTQEELAIGAVASWGDHELVLDNHAIALLGVSEEYIQKAAARQLAEINRRLIAYRGTERPPDVAGRTVILVDDGIATGYTLRAAAIALRHLRAERIVLATPVGAPDSVHSLERHVDEMVCLRTPSPFMAVGYWYRDFKQVSDAEVIEVMARV